MYWLKGNRSNADLRWGQSKLTFALGQTKPRQGGTNLQPWKAVTTYYTTPLQHEQVNKRYKTALPARLSKSKLHHPSSWLRQDFWTSVSGRLVLVTAFVETSPGFPSKVFIPLLTLLKLEHKTKIPCLCLKTITYFICSLSTLLPLAA